MKELNSHQEAWNRLKGAAVQGTFPQSLLIEGAPGIGKRAFAIRLARALICTQPQEGEACGLCSSCLGWNPTEGSPFLSWVVPCKIVKTGTDSSNQTRLIKALEEKRSQILEHPFDLNTFQAQDQVYIEQIRQIQSEASFTRSQRQVVFIPEANRLTSSSANALLKILEEAPENLYFILTTSNRSSLLPTILSRCSRIFLPPNEMGEILEVIQGAKDLGIDPQVMVHLSDFSIGKCLHLIQGNPAQERDLAMEFVERVALEKPGRFQLWLKNSKQIETDRESAIKLLQSLELVWSDFLALKLAKPFRNQDIEGAMLSHPIMNQSQSYFFEAYDLFGEAKSKILGNSNVVMTLIALGLKLKSRLQ